MEGKIHRGTARAYALEIWPRGRDKDSRQLHNMTYGDVVGMVGREDAEKLREFKDELDVAVNVATLKPKSKAKAPAKKKAASRVYVNPDPNPTQTPDTPGNPPKPPDPKDRNTA